MSLHEAHKHPALLTKILVKLNEPENEGYQKEVVDFLSPILYIKQKFKPVIGSYKKVKMNYVREVLDSRGGTKIELSGEGSST